jgi:cation diffusion facilitator family transporter
MSYNQLKINAMKLTLVVGFILMGLKFFAYYLTRSNAILTDAIESIVNVLAGTFALYSVFYAAKPRDEDHPYGHGKIEFLSTGVEGGMVTLAGLAMTIKGILSFFEKHELHNIDIGLGISIFSGTVNYFLARMLIQKGKGLHSSTMVADGKHLMTDTWSSIGLVCGLVLIYFTNLFWIDFVITIGLGVFIMVTGIRLIRESIFNLLDKADYIKIEHLINVLNTKRNPSWIDIHNLRVVKYGAVVHVDCHMTLPWYYTLEESHKEVDDLDKLVTTEFSHEIEFFIHADPCVPKSCSICEIYDCKVRRDAFVKRLQWTMENVLPDEKHTANPIL